MAGRAVNLIAVDVDVGEVVVGAYFLNLAQGVLESVPVPQSNILKRSLIMRWVGRGYICLSRELALRNPIQSVGLPRQCDIVGNIGLLANEFVWFHDEATDVPGNYLKQDITQRSGENCRGDPAAVRFAQQPDLEFHMPDPTRIRARAGHQTGGYFDADANR